MPSRLSSLIELSGCLATVLIASLLATVGILSLPACIWLTALFLIAMLFLSWYRFDGGRHPCFLFIGMLLVFQGGRLIGYMTGMIDNPMLIEVETPRPISVSTHSAELTLLILTLSALFIYIPCRLTYKPSEFHIGNETAWLQAIYAMVLLTLPFALYKNVAYLSYIRAHGGYLAVYTDNAEVLQSAGLLARSVSLLNASAIMVAFVLEKRPKRLALIVFVFFGLSTLDLLIGFRGKFFTQAIAMWFIFNLKTGRRFKLIPLTVIAVLISVLAVTIAGFREEQSVELLSPVGLIAQQGISLNVTEAAVQFSNIFSRYGAGYVWGGFVNGFAPTRTNAPGWLWSGDLSVYMNPVASSLGFGTASSYLAELFLFAGIPAVILGSLAIGYALSLLHNLSSRPWGAVVLAFALPSMIYLPRLELLNPAATLIKSLISLAPVAVFAFLFRFEARLLRSHIEMQRESIHNPRDITSM